MNNIGEKSKSTSSKTQSAKLHPVTGHPDTFTIEEGGRVKGYWIKGSGFLSVGAAIRKLRGTGNGRWKMVTY